MPKVNPTQGGGAPVISAASNSDLEKQANDRINKMVMQPFLNRATSQIRKTYKEMGEKRKEDK